MNGSNYQVVLHQTKSSLTMEIDTSDSVANNIEFFQKFSRLVANERLPIEDEYQQLKEDLERTKKAFHEYRQKYPWNDQIESAIKNEIERLNTNLLASQQQLVARTTQLERTETKLQTVEKEKAEQETRVQALETEICKLNQERNDCKTILLNLFEKLGLSFAPNAHGVANSFLEKYGPLENLQIFLKLIGVGTTFKERVKDKALEAVRVKIEKDYQHEVILKHKKAPRSKAKNNIGVYPCICRKGYCSHRSLQNHQRYSKTKDVPCPYSSKDDERVQCAQKFRNRIDFKIHCRKEHGIGYQENLVCCSLCTQYFYRSELYQHRRAKHLVDLTREDYPKNV